MPYHTQFLELHAPSSDSAAGDKWGRPLIPSGNKSLAGPGARPGSPRFIGPATKHGNCWMQIVQLLRANEACIN